MRSKLGAPVLVALALILALVSGGCGMTGGTLGGREKCWPAEPPRAASIWRGVLVIDETGGQLQTPEGEAIPLAPGALTTRVGSGGAGELVDASGNVAARAGDDVTLFGGAGGDGFLVVCGVEEKHSA